MRKLFLFLIIFFPWPIKKWILKYIYKYKIHPNTKIGLSYINIEELIMNEGSKIGHFNVIINFNKLSIGKNSSIGNFNWITGHPLNSNDSHFKHQKDRENNIIIGNESAITKNHHIDCTNLVTIGNYVTIAGYYSQLLTHSIDINKNIQDSKAIQIGDYCFIGTNCIILGGSKLPSYSVLAAKSLLNKVFNNEYKLYGGIPTKGIKQISKGAKHFNREQGFVY